MAFSPFAIQAPTTRYTVYLAPVYPAPITFFTLHEFIRKQIYRYVFTHDRRSEPPEEGETHLWAPTTFLKLGEPSKPKWTNVGLLGTCRLIRVEAQPIFFEINWYSHLQPPFHTLPGAIQLMWWERCVVSLPMTKFRVLRVDVGMIVVYHRNGIAIERDATLSVTFDLNPRRLAVTIKAFPMDDQGDWFVLPEAAMRLMVCVKMILDAYEPGATHEWRGESIFRLARFTMGLEGRKQLAQVIPDQEPPIFGFWGQCIFVMLRRAHRGASIHETTVLDICPPPAWELESY
ncbi:hypothetical protein NA57DRAFT_79714 [Rhizodiscina lignyota]|uniref:Uncharacterized protein n=1 Tax=Rhizodiscina lignyota TaxID=1504668 RepID=A0A9P4I593_9PEZI|nr:hypothetical protein NA57DRAFT_79714 [Rhizodiscina lignyota]